MNFINICIHPGVSTSEPQKVLDLVAFAKKFLSEFPGEGETPLATLEPWANTDDRFSVVLGVKIVVEGPFAFLENLEKRRRAMEKFAEDHYPHFSRAVVVTDATVTPATFPNQERG